MRQEECQPVKVVDEAAGTRGFQAFVEMRDGVRLNTLVFLPPGSGPFR